MVLLDLGLRLQEGAVVRVVLEEGGAEQGADVAGVDGMAHGGAPDVRPGDRRDVRRVPRQDLRHDRPGDVVIAARDHQQRPRSRRRHPFGQNRHQQRDAVLVDAAAGRLLVGASPKRAEQIVDERHIVASARPAGTMGRSP